jgi:type IC specificity subunit
MRNKPRIRFKGFTEDWEQCKLGDLLILLKDGSHGTHKNTSEGVYLLSAKNIKNGRINIMHDDRIISWDDYNVIHKNYELQIGDILLTIVGSIGETAIYNLKMKVTFQRSVAFLRPNSKLKNGFLYTLINTDRFQSQLQTKQVVSAQPGIYLGDLASINITYPKNVSEQEKIYNIFKGIEDSITLHQRKLEKLKLAKKALLQKLFPKNGSQFPEIRFKGFTDAWEQRKLGDIATFSKGNGYSKSDLASSGNPIILYGRLYTNYETTISNVDTFVELKDKSVISQGGEVIVPASGETAEDISRASVVKKQGIIIGGDLNVIKANHLLDPTFLALTISNGEQQKELSKRAQGKSVVHLHNSDLQEVNLTFPLLNEQKEISTLFEKMDNIITLHQRKLDKLQEMKKGLLQKMFV